MKKLSNNIIKIIPITILCIIIINQISWIRNMYIVYQQEMYLEINEALEKAIFMEINERSEQVGGFSYQCPLDAENVIQKQILCADTTYFCHDKNDRHRISKILHILIQDKVPLDIYRLDTIFREELSLKKFPVKITYLEQIDLNTDSLIAQNTQNTNLSSYIKSNQFSLDPEDSIAVQAYVQTPIGKVLANMQLQLILSILLIFTSFTLIFILARTIFTHRKEEKMRQASINAMIHEFKRPISSAIAQIALIPYYLDKSDSALVKQYAENTLLELNKLTAYTERIQQISNNEKGKIVLNLVEIDIVPFVNSLVTKYSYKHDADKEINIELEADTSLYTMRADLLHFSNMMDNLLENAIKYSNPTVNIIISVKSNSQYFCIGVKDDGFGIPENDKFHIFERFYRIRQKETQGKTGLGLGLTYVKVIIEAHGGKIDVISEPGRGSEFVIYVPIK